MPTRAGLRSLVLALAGVMAIAGLSPGSAGAQNGRISARAPFYMSGVAQKGGTLFTYPYGEEIACRRSRQRWEQVGGGPVRGGASAFTVAPTFSGCTAAAGPFRATVSMNGCDFVFRVGETVNVREYELNAGFSCPAGGHGLIHVYLDSALGSFLACTVHLTSRPKIKGAKLLYQGKGRALLTGTMAGLHDSQSGLCGFSSSPSVRYVVSTELKGVGPSAAPVGIRIDD